MTSRTVDPDEQSYYWSNGEKIPLEPEPGALAIKFTERTDDLDLTRLTRRHRQLLRNRSKRGEFIEKYGLQIYHAAKSTLGPPDATEDSLQRRTLEIARDLNDEEGVEYVTPVYRRSPGSSDHVYVTDRFVAGFRQEVAEDEGRIEAFNDENGVEIVESVGYAPNAFVLRAPKEVGAVAMANRYHESGLVTFANPDLVRRTTHRGIRVYELARETGHSNEEILDRLEDLGVETMSHLSAIDPPVERQLRDRLSTPATETTHSTGRDRSVEVAERGEGNGGSEASSSTRSSETALAERSAFLDRQWHLQNAAVKDAWQITRGDPKITIAIMDDGIDIDHPEFEGKVRGQYDFMINRADGRPKDWEDKHGTACAGVATAAGKKAFGVAPDCGLLAIRFPGSLGSVEEAEMFRWATDNGADIVSCSWGPADNEGPAYLPDNVRIAIEYCARQGRDGKGCPIFWASGNGGESVMDDGWATHDDVITVGASTSENTYATYSDFGPKISVVAPSSGDWDQGTKDVFTTDRTDFYGYNHGDPAFGDEAGNYTNEFGGTSSAAPLAASVGALMLSVNPSLSASQLRSMLESTADEIGNEPYSNGRNDRFGHGRVNARAAVEASRDGSSQPATKGTVSAPSEVARTDAPPTFEVTLGDWDEYAVEVTTDVELFDQDANGSRRDDSNFYSSFTDVGPLTGGRFELPIPVWSRLKDADRLYYRGLFTDDSTSAIHYTVTDDEASASGAASQVPSIVVNEPDGSGPTTTGTWPIVRSGDSGRDVTTLQYLLSDDGFWLDVDGAFGPITRDVVERFQSQAGITVDGVVGPETWIELVPRLSRGDFGQGVRGLQTQLAVSVDGDFGPATEAAVESFQSSAGLTIDGTVGHSTWSALLAR